MKTLRLVLLTCFAVASLASCEKPEDLNPDLVTRVTGDYPFTHVVDNGNAYSIGQTNLSGKATIERKSSTSLKLAWSYKGGGSSYSGSYTGVALTEAANGDLEMRYNGSLIAVVTDDVLELSTDSNGKEMTFLGRR